MDAPAVAVTADGKKFAASWMDCQLKEGDRDVFWTLGGKKTRALSIGGGEQGHSSLTCDEKGVFWVAWEERSAGKSEVWYTRSEKGFSSQRLSDMHLDGSASVPLLAYGGGCVAAVYQTGAREVILRVLRDGGSMRDRR